MFTIIRRGLIDQLDQVVFDYVRLEPGQMVGFTIITLTITVSIISLHKIY